MNSMTGTVSQRICRLGVLVGVLLGVLPPLLHAQQKVSFYTTDSVKVNADLYLNDYGRPFILFFHQAEGSRGEYANIAPRLQKLSYNCLVVDMRVGGKMNYQANQTALYAKENNKARTLMDADREIEAAIAFVRRYNQKDVVLVGSSFAASLCLMRSTKSKGVKATIAMSPGEYFRPELIVKDQLKYVDVPVFISTTQAELKFVEQMLTEVSPAYLKYFSPGSKQGAHGAKMLWDDTEASDACWFDLLLFFKNIRYE